jgi:hypothetical protein
MGEVTIVSKEVLEAEGYESAYVKCYNYITDKGWVFKDKKWHSPCGTYAVDNTEKAAKKQKFLEDILNRTT